MGATSLAEADIEGPGVSVHPASAAIAIATALTAAGKRPAARTRTSISTRVTPTAPPWHSASLDGRLWDNPRVIATAQTVLAPAQWRAHAEAHERRADAATAERRARAARGETHAVDDFLYDYYSTRPSLLRRWHPGVGVTLQSADAHATWRWYVTDAAGTRVDARTFWEARGATVDWVTGLIASTLAKPGKFGCFGLHEWAMVYRDDVTRHPLPLRLGVAGTNAVVEENSLVCTHYDAFRFFTPEAEPLNASTPTRAMQALTEQPGCLHATMDLYKWCVKLTPAIPSELTMDCFDLAVDVRRLDMAASPYDVSQFGWAPVAIETPAGKREYAERQREIAARGEVLRRRILAACDAIRIAAGA